VNDRNPWVGRFVGRLTALADPAAPDRATLAHLRRGLGEPVAVTLGHVGWLFDGVPDDGNGRALDAAVLAAGLFAWAKGRCAQADGTNFGRAFGNELSEDQKKQRERRFTALLDADRSELPFLLRQAVTLVEGQPLDWKQLLRDLVSWEHEDRFVQKQWARGFWWTPAPKTDADTATEPSEAATP
jgi:CRISPR system Cascade subunit CasB